MNPFDPSAWQRFTGVVGQVPAGTACAVAVSGGVDSIVLLDLLHRCVDRRWVVLHLNHQLRGDAAVADADFVRRLALAKGCDFECGLVNVAALAESEGCSIESAGRLARRKFYGEVCAARGIGSVFLGHHADDQAETMLWNLLRGSGAEGLTGMSDCAPMPDGGPVLLRPMLGFWRSEVLAYAEERGLEFREDATNADPAFLRNRLRHVLLPQMEELLGRPVRRNLVHAAEIISAENEVLQAAVDAAAPEMQPELRVDALRDLPVAVQRRFLRRWLEMCGAGGCGFLHVEAVRSLLEVRPGVPAKVNLPGNRHARRRGGVLFME